MCHFYIDEWQFVNKYKHTCGIKKIYAEPYGMSIAFIDDKIEGFIYNPVNSNIVKIPDMSPNTLGVVWEAFEPEKVSELNYYFSILFFLQKFVFQVGFYCIRWRKCLHLYLF